MRWMIGSLAVLLTIPVSARADEREDCLKIINKAIKAGGGEEKFIKAQKATSKSKGVYHGMGQPIDYTGEWVQEIPKRMRMDLEIDAGGMKIAIAMIFDGKKAWEKANNDVKELDKDRVQGFVEELHASTVMNLVGLKEKAYTLASLGESKIDGKPAVGVKVSHKDRNDVSLFFDKESGMIVKVEQRVKDMGGQEVNQESFLSGYKEFGGFQVPTKVKIMRDGKVYVEDETAEWKAVDKLEDSLFAKPS